MMNEILGVLGPAGAGHGQGQGQGWGGGAEGGSENLRREDGRPYGPSGQRHTTADSVLATRGGAAPSGAGYRQAPSEMEDISSTSGGYGYQQQHRSVLKGHSD